jgi:hypothetical protein
VKGRIHFRGGSSRIRSWCNTRWVRGGLIHDRSRADDISWVLRWWRPGRERRRQRMIHDLSRADDISWVLSGWRQGRERRRQRHTWRNNRRQNWSKRHRRRDIDDHIIHGLNHHELSSSLSQGVVIIDAPHGGCCHISSNGKEKESRENLHLSRREVL